MRVKYAPSNNLNDRDTVHYCTQGEGGNAHAFTHGATMDHTLLNYQLDFFSKDFRVICWDVPAHGLSRPCANFTFQHADEVAKPNPAGALMRVLSSPKATCLPNFVLSG